MKYLTLFLCVTNILLAGTTYMDPMLFDTSASATALGGINSFGNSALAVYDNPSVLELQHNNIAISNYQLIEDIGYLNLALKFGRFGFGIIQIGSQDYETSLNNYGEAFRTKTFEYKNNLYLLNYHFKRQKMLYGINFKLYQGVIKDTSALGINIDVGMTYKFTEEIWLSNTIINVLNMGRFGVDWNNGTNEKLPTIFSTSLRLKNSLLTAYLKYDMVDFMVSEGKWHAGIEMSFFDMLRIMGGLQEIYSEANNKSIQFSYGLILQFSGMSLEFSQTAISNFILAEQMNRISIGISF